jgi:thiol-disulfide isomerase/thioredoxin
MKMRVLSIFLILAGFAFGQAKTGAKLGEAPPPLTVEEWLKGEPVKALEAGKVYLVEFWGTWCGPCLENIPHLTKLQKQYEKDGLIVVGVASHEFKERGILDAFMKERGAEMAYRVAFDADQSMERDWDTGGREGVQFRLPLSFIIDRGGRVRFVGHPSDPLMDKTIAEALNRS